MKPDVLASVALVRQIAAIPTVLEVVCKTTGLGFAAVARVTEDSWVACEVLDNIDFGLKAGGELRIETTICNEIRDHLGMVVIDDVSKDAFYTNHHTPAMYGFQSYISVPIVLPDGTFFGTLCGIDPHPKALSKPEIVDMFTLFAELIAVHVDARIRLGTSKEALAKQQVRLNSSEESLRDEQARHRISRGDLETERARLLASETNLKEEREVAELREQFIAVLGHDLRNPLAALRGGTELLQRRDSEPRDRKILTMMTASVKRMSDLIDNLLDFARGRLGGGITLQRETKSVEPTLAHVIAEIRTAWPDRVIETEFHLSHPVDADHARLGQLFSNLLGNAIAHGSTDQPIRVKAMCCEGCEFELSVANGGAAIPPAMLKKIFQPFYRGDAQSRAEGIGLGLFISAQIAEAHGGTLSVASDATETVFTAKFPLTTE